MKIRRGAASAPTFLLHACWFTGMMLLGTGAPVLAQQRYSFRSWTVTTGLPDDNVRAMRRTRDGYLWLATSEGLVCWDGVRFRVFDVSNTPSLRSDHYAFSALMEDSSGGIWAGTDDEGVVRFKDGVFLPLGVREGLPGNSVERIDEDTQGNIWIYTTAGLSRWRQGRLEAIGSAGMPAEPSRTASFPVSMGYDSAHLGLWRGTSHGVERFAFGQWRHFPTPPGMDIRTMSVKSIYEDMRGRIWYNVAGRRDEHYESDGGALTVYHNVPPDFFVCWQDDEGALWMTDHQAHGAVLRDGHLQRLPQFSTPNVFNVVPGGPGEMWIGTLSAGLLRVQRGLTPTLRQAGSPEIPAAFLLDRRGILWVASTAVEQLRDHRLVTAASLLPKTTSLIFYSATFDDADRGVLLANQQALVSVTASGATVFRSLAKYGLDIINTLCGDGAGGFWLGGEGLLHLTANKATKLSSPEGVPVSTVHGVLPNGSGGYFVATPAGLSQLSLAGAGPAASTGRWTLDPRWQGGPATDLLRSSDGVVWIGTSRSSLFLMRGSAISPVAPAVTGLLGQAVTPLLEEQEGRQFYIWFRCANRLVRMRRDDLEQTPGGVSLSLRSLILDETNGYPDLHQMADGSQHFILYRDQLLIGANDAVIVLNPAALHLDESPIHVAIEEASVDDSASRLANEVQVRPGQASLQIQYTGLRNTDPETIRFRYRLRGLDDRWSDVGSRRVAYFAHLPAGRYTFEVSAIAADGKRSENTAALPVIVLPHFYERTLFRLAALAAVLLLALFLVQRRHSRLLQAQALQRAFSRQMMNSQESERRRIAAELHDSLGQHMVLINNLSLLGRAQPPSQNGSGDELYTQIGEQSAEALRELRAISYNLRPYHLDRLGLTQAIQALAQQVAGSFPGRLLTQLENIDGDIPPDLEIAFYRIVQECLSNTLKHSRAASVTVTVAKTADRIVLEVEDDGCGLPSAQTSSGFGLIGMRERATALGGEIAIENAPQGGTLVRLTVPIERSF